MTSCLLHLVALFLIGLRLGDSHLVILSLCSLALFFVINFLCIFGFSLFCTPCFALCFFCIEKFFEYTFFLLIHYFILFLIGK